jgi:hypothetical protein
MIKKDCTWAIVAFFTGGEAAAETAKANRTSISTILA